MQKKMLEMELKFNVNVKYVKSTFAKKKYMPFQVL